MALGEYERQALLFNLHVQMVPEEAKKVMSMAAAMILLQKIFNDGEASMRIGDHLPDADTDSDNEQTEGENVISIQKMKIDGNGIASILLHHGDAAAADPALMEINTGKVRSAGKKPNEGLAHAAHFMISAKKHTTKSGQSHALLERVPNLGRSTVMAFINRLLRERAKQDGMEFEDEKTKRPKRCHPRIDAHQQMSHSLREDLEGGKLSAIEFVTRKVVAGFEEKNLIVPVTQTIVHKVINAPTGSRAFDLLERAKAYARKNNYEEMQVRFRKPDTDQYVSPRFATDLSDAKDAVYSRFEALGGFREPLKQCPTDLVDPVCKKMVKLFDEASLWK